MEYCQECGTRLTQNICPNCEEELFILTYQEFPDDDFVGKDFLDEAESQRDKVRERKRIDNANKRKNSQEQQ